MKQKEFEKINKDEAKSLIDKYSGRLINEITTDAGYVYVLSNGRAVITSSYDKKAYYYYDSHKFTTDPHKEDEIWLTKISLPISRRTVWQQ